MDKKDKMPMPLKFLIWLVAVFGTATVLISIGRWQNRDANSRMTVAYHNEVRFPIDISLVSDFADKEHTCCPTGSIGFPHHRKQFKKKG